MKLLTIIAMFALPVALMAFGAIVVSDWVNDHLLDMLLRGTGWSKGAGERIIMYGSMATLVALVWYHVTTLMRVFEGAFR